MRICSFLPSATEIIAELGLLDELVGVSAECRWPPEVVGRPVVTGASFASDELDDLTIDRTVRAALADGRSLYLVDEGLLEELAPDVIVTQDLCTVCAVSSGEVRALCSPGTRLISLDPRTVADVAASVSTLGAALGALERAATIASRMRETIAEVAACVADLPRRRIFFAEWIQPPFTAGHWLPEMIELAGGEDVLGLAGHPSRETSWDEVRVLDPDLVIVGPCGFDERVAAARTASLRLPFPAVAVDGDSYYSRPSPRLAEGVRQLAYLLHPESVEDPGLPAIALPSASASLCPTCAYMRPVAGKRGQTYYLCRSESIEAKYPRQPVTACPAYSTRSRTHDG
jgi:iron complex transport system substrate-binding protein